MLQKLRQRLAQARQSVSEVTPVTPTPRSAFGARDDTIGQSCSSRASSSSARLKIIDIVLNPCLKPCLVSVPCLSKARV